jgi:transposase
MKEVTPMAKRIRYRATAIEQISCEKLASKLLGAQKLVVAIDVAKTKMVAGFGPEDGSVACLVKWNSPTDNRAFVDLVTRTAQTLDVPVDAVLEPTGTYGESLRALLIAAGAQVYVMSPKRVHDAAEVFDGVPSMHDPKACVVIAELHHKNISRLYVPTDPVRLQLRALTDQRELYAKPLHFYLGQLEALLARHWPEALRDMDVWGNKTPLAVLAHYPSPGELLENAAQAIERIHELGHKHLQTKQVQLMMRSAQGSTGIPPCDEAKQLIRIAASEALRMRTALDAVDRQTEQVAELAEPTQHLAPVVGKVTAVALVAYLGAFTDYESAAALEKACGLNLKIRSSGNYVGRLKLTKRGSAAVRRYLYMAALRLIQRDPLIARWYRARAGYRGGRKLVAIVAVMRKLARALWHIARGRAFDSTLLVDERALPSVPLVPAKTTDLTTSRDAQTPLH